MIEQDQNADAQAINIGIYGCTKAGKTRFLFQLINRWDRTRRVLCQSETCQKFLETVEREIQKHNGSMPTAATTEGIKVKIRRHGNEAPLQLVFRDLRGELLSGELDQIATLDRNGVIPTQVRQCDAFLFFFDPASSEDSANIDSHHLRELKRAKMFIEHVLDVRQNRHLPIIFVQTHLDRWENDADVRTKAERWIDDVHSKLVELYDSRLQRLYPKSIADRSRTTFTVSSVGNTQESDVQLENVVEQLSQLLVDSAAYQRRLKKPGRFALGAGVAVLAALPLIFWLLSSPNGGSKAVLPGDDRISIAEMSERDVLARLDELDRTLQAHPRLPQLPSPEEAKNLNDHLRWLAQRLEPDSGGTSGLADKTQRRMRSALESFAKLVHEQEERKGVSPAELTPVLASYLDDLPDLVRISPDLATAQSRFWQLERERAVEELRAILKRRKEVVSAPIDTVGEVLDKLRSVEQELRRRRVFGPQSRSDLVEEIQAAVTFCEDRKKSKSYALAFRVVSAADSPKKQADLAWRNLRVTSPGRKDWLSENGVALIPNNEQIPVDVSASVVWGQKSWDGYANSVKVSIDGVELWNVSAKSKPNTRSELGVQRIARKRSDAIVFDGHVRVSDGTFMMSSREHGTGRLSVEVGNLLDEAKNFPLDRYENCISITAKPADEGRPNEFHTKEPKYQAELGLGSPVTCVLSVHEESHDTWRKLHEFELTSEQGPLAPLGLPLVRPRESDVTKLLRWERMELKLEFSGFPPVPPLLWDAAKSAKEPNP